MKDDVKDSETPETRDADLYDSRTFSRIAPLRLQLPVRESVLAEARKLVSNWNARVEDIAACVAEDPVLTLEVCRTANAMFFRQDRPPIVSVRTAVVRLGVVNLVELTQDISDRKSVLVKSAQQYFDQLRDEARAVSLVASRIAVVLRPDFTMQAQLTGLMSRMGRMLACAYLGERYVALAEEHSGAALVYRLAKEYDFDINYYKIAYLERYGLPAELLFALVKDLPLPSQSMAPFRFIIRSAVELVESFGSEKWDRYRPGNDLPGYSNLRLLRMSQRQYNMIFEAIEPVREELHAIRLNSSDKVVEENSTAAELTETSSAQIGELLSEHELKELFDSRVRRTIISEEQKMQQLTTAAAKTQPIIPSQASSLTTATETKSPIKINIDETFAYPLLKEFIQLCNNVASTTRLLEQLLTKLTLDGPFLRAAIVKVRGDHEAEVEQGFGYGLHTGLRVKLLGTLVPVASKDAIIRYDGDGIEAPFGAQSFAVYPLEFQDNIQTLLYADCGEGKELTLEARRVFRDFADVTAAALGQMQQK